MTALLQTVGKAILPPVKSKTLMLLATYNFYKFFMLNAKHILIHIKKTYPNRRYI